MANNLYDKAREAFLNGEISWKEDTIKVVLVGTPLGGTSTYTAKTAGSTSHQFLSDIPQSSRLATADLVRDYDGDSNDSSLGVAKGRNVTFSNVTGTIKAIVIYKHTGNDATAPVIAYLDDINGQNNTITSSTPVTITWDTQNGIFKL
jgi:hypothetical protein